MPRKMVFVLVEIEYGAVKIDSVTPDEQIADNWSDDSTLERPKFSVEVGFHEYHPK